MPKTLGIDTKTKPLAPFGPIPPLTPHIGPLCVLSRPNSDLVKQVFDIQLKKPVRNDWVLTVKDDLEMLDIKLSFEDIGKESKESFSKLVKERVRSLAFSEFMEEKNQLSKLKDLSYNELKMQNYLSAKNVNTDTAKNIFKYRTRMTFLKGNFRTQFVNNLQCYECEIAEDSQQHL